MKNKVFILISIVILFVTACGKNEAGTIGNDLNPNPQKVSLMLDWYPNAVHSFLFAAEEKGYFKEQGLDVEIQMPADTNDPLRLVAANQIDIAISYQPQVIVARSENIPVQSFGALVRQPLTQLMVHANSPIQIPKDLAGKTIGYSSIPLYEAIIQTMVKKDGEDINKVKMVDIGWDLIPAMTTNKTDGIIGGFINHEKLLLEKEGYPIRLINPSEFGVPNYYELVLVGSESRLKEKPEVFKKFLAAITKGQQFVKDHPEESLDLLMNHEDQTSPLELEIEKKSLEILLPLMDAKDKPFGYQDLAVWTEVSQWLFDYKVLSNQVKPEDAFINF
jgi:putative hydroxymethylpyrimidine transport system substrate-binding protein